MPLRQPCGHRADRPRWRYDYRCCGLLRVCNYELLAVWRYNYVSTGLLRPATVSARRRIRKGDWYHNLMRQGNCAGCRSEASRRGFKCSGKSWNAAMPETASRSDRPAWLPWLDTCPPAAIRSGRFQERGSRWSHSYVRDGCRRPASVSARRRTGKGDWHHNAMGEGNFAGCRPEASRRGFKCSGKSWNAAMPPTTARWRIRGLHPSCKSGRLAASYLLSHVVSPSVTGLEFCYILRPA